MAMDLYKDINLDELIIDKEYFPPKHQIFKAFTSFDKDNLKVVILGQDPYHQKGQANGLAFSVNDHIKIPPSLKNIYKELNNDLEIDIPLTGNLDKWAEQGVLLLNTSLTVCEGKPNCHNKIWEPITNNMIEKISLDYSNLVFILWGNHAKNKRQFIKGSHLILEGGHPSPLNRYKDKIFFGQKFFSKTNEYLEKNGKTKINW